MCSMNTNQRLVFEQDFSDESKFFETEEEDYCIESYGLFEDLTMDYDDADQEPEIVRLAKGALNGNR